MTEWGAAIGVICWERNNIYSSFEGSSGGGEARLGGVFLRFKILGNHYLVMEQDTEGI